MIKTSKQNRGYVVLFSTYDDNGKPAKPNHVYFRVMKKETIVESGEMMITDLARSHELIKQMDNANCPF